MSQKEPRRKFSTEDKHKAVDAYMSGEKSVVEIAADLQVSPELIYKWKSNFELERKRSGINKLTDSGISRAAALKIQQQEDEIAHYQKKVAELTLINDLLKKLQTSPPSVRENELAGLIATFKKSAQKPKPVV
jgi:transposase-like protein